MKQELPTAPDHLSEQTATWWRQVIDEYTLEPHHIRLLTLAAEAWDRGQQARQALLEHGVTYLDRFQQPKSRPEVAIERDSRIAFARLIRELGLDVSEPDESKPPTIPGNSMLRVRARSHGTS
jgi:P27 family predicted phage terminase small subunit